MKPDIPKGKTPWIPKEDVELVTELIPAYNRMVLFDGSYFPHGELKETDVFVEDKIGFYYCDIDQSILWEGFKDDIELNLNELQYDNLKKGNLPNIYPEKVFIESKRTGDFLGLKENDYSSKKILKDYLISSVMIKQLKKYNCKSILKKVFILLRRLKDVIYLNFYWSL